LSCFRLAVRGWWKSSGLPTPCQRLANDVPTTFRLVELAVVERLIAGSLVN
jgi:hypothetical protein